MGSHDKLCIILKYFPCAKASLTLFLHPKLQAGLLFFVPVFWGFFPVFTAIFTFPQERAMLNKERAVDMYKLSAYFMARTTSDLPLDLILPILFMLIVYFMAGLKLSPGPFFLSLVIVFLDIIAAEVCEILFQISKYIGDHIFVADFLFKLETGGWIGYRSFSDGHKEGNNSGFSNSHDFYVIRWILR